MFVGFGKKQEPEMMDVPEKPTLPSVPIPPQLPPFKEINDKLDDIKEMIQAHHWAIMDRIIPEETISLNEEELKLVPEDDKNTYLDLKKNNPKMAEKLLKGYGKK